MNHPNVFGLAALVALAVTGPVAAAAQQSVYCGARAAIVERLGQKFGEARTGGGLMSQDQLLEIWSAPDTGTWTALLTRADGVSCILGSGDNWYQALPVAASQGTAS